MEKYKQNRKTQGTIVARLFLGANQNKLLNTRGQGDSKSRHVHNVVMRSILCAMRILKQKKTKSGGNNSCCERNKKKMNKLHWKGMFL